MKIVGVIAASLLALCAVGKAGAETIKVGVVLPYSGPNSDLGNQIDKAFDLYVKLHAKDLGNNKIELIKRDEGPPSGANARTVATELITNDKVKLLTGFVFSPSAIAVAPLATQAKMPMLIANAGTAWITKSFASLVGRALINAPPLTSRLEDQHPLSGTNRKCDIGSLLPRGDRVRR